ncbi:MAG: sugar MFS transporter [Bacteroidales bacterium]|nr:sugar MFS transporter [Bacteroidales bacterium]MBR6491563.1 sugar MFS transporter [Bacteroidales bacterium]
MGNNNKQVFYLFIIGVFYFIFGFVTWLNGTLIPFLQKTCELNQFEAYLVTFAFYISYFVWSLPSSAILKKTGFKKGLAIGLFVMAIGAALFIPAASSRSYILFLLGLFILGSGLALMQTAVNPYVTILGPIETAARRMSIMGICNKFAGILAPIILGAVLLSGLDEIEDLTVLSHRLVTPYLIMTIVLVALGFLILAVDLPEPNEEEDKSAKNTKKTIWQYPYLWFGIIALFFYVGVEVIAGDSVINYGRALGVDMISAKYFTSITLLGMVIGYFIGVALIPKVISQRQALIGCSTLGIIFAILALSVDVTKSITFPFIDLTSFHPITMHIPLTVLFVCLMGLANSLVWPAIWPLALDGVGHHTKTASALLIMAIAGGAVMPLILGKLNDVIGFQQAYWITIPCYVIILCFALFGYKLGKNR